MFHDEPAFEPPWYAFCDCSKKCFVLEKVVGARRRETDTDRDEPACRYEQDQIQA
jgi:hypothetical protein